MALDTINKKVMDCDWNLTTISERGAVMYYLQSIVGIISSPIYFYNTVLFLIPHANQVK